MVKVARAHDLNHIVGLVSKTRAKPNFPKVKITQLFIMYCRCVTDM